MIPELILAAAVLTLALATWRMSRVHRELGQILTEEQARDATAPLSNAIRLLDDDEIAELDRLYRDGPDE